MFDKLIGKTPFFGMILFYQLLLIGFAFTKLMIIGLALAQLKQPFKSGMILIASISAPFLILPIIQIIPGTWYLNLLAMAAACTPILSIWILVKPKNSTIRGMCLPFAFIDLAITAYISWLLLVFDKPVVIH